MLAGDEDPAMNNAWLDLLAAIADQADSIAMACFRRQDLRVESKPDRSLVTEADVAIEEVARRMAHQRHPELDVLGEEQGEEAREGRGRLIIDPIDATANFVRGIPIFATLLAIENEGVLEAALVSAPALRSRWFASRDNGAYRSDGRRLGVSTVGRLADAQAFHGSVAGREAAAAPPGQRRLLDATSRQRGFGDFYQHVLVCEGAGEIAIDFGVKPWDVAALMLLVVEAGGQATALDGSRSLDAGSLVTTNGLLHREVLALLNDRGVES
jgi:histidinol-phosphatase